MLDTTTVSFSSLWLMDPVPVAHGGSCVRLSNHLSAVDCLQRGTYVPIAVNIDLGNQTQNMSNQRRTTSSNTAHVKKPTHSCSSS